MLSERSRNSIVGLTILVALAVCMYGIILLGKLPVFSVRQYLVTLNTSNANGVGSGSRVELNGVYVGQVRSAYLQTAPDGTLTVKAQLLIDPEVDIPESATASISRPVTGMGSPTVSITATDARGKMLPKDGTATIMATAGDSGLIPKEVFADIHVLKEDLSVLAHELTTVARDMHTLLAYTPPEALENADPNDPNRPRENASTVIIRLDRTVASLQTLLTDPKLQGQVRDAVQNIADASAQLKKTMEKVDTAVTTANTAFTSVSAAAGTIGTAATQATATIQATEKNIDRVSQQLVETLAQLDKTIRQISDNKGTTGRLINDPRLYDGLLDLSKSLKTTVDDLDFLVNKWKDEGVNLHLK